MPKTKRPAFQFYPGDWLRSTDVRTCSVGARGLWIDMICLMHEGTPYGHLKVSRKVILPDNLAKIVGATLAEVEGWLLELEEVGVFSRDEEGTIFSRRMIRDEEIREKRASGGCLGGNPELKKKKEDAGKDNLPPTIGITPASSSASASSKKIKEEDSSEPSQGRLSEQPSAVVPAAVIVQRRPPDPPEDGVLEFPVVGKPDVPTWWLTEPMVVGFLEAYPDLDVIREFRKALQWIRMSPSRRKTAGGMGKFLNGWLGRAQNDGRTKSTGGGGGASREETRMRSNLGVLADFAENG